jgi:hypothetical protein
MAALGALRSRVRSAAAFSIALSPPAGRAFPGDVEAALPDASRFKIANSLILFLSTNADCRR